MIAADVKPGLLEQFKQPELRPALLSLLREKARHGAGVRELVRTVQAELGYDENALLPVLWYFVQAFHVPLPAVLPIREWLGTDKDEEIDRTVLPAIQRTKLQWSTDAEQTAE